MANVTGPANEQIKPAKMPVREYTMSELSEVLTVCEEDLAEYVRQQNLELKPNGNLTKKSSQLVFEFFQNGVSLNGKKNGIQLDTKDNSFFESEDGRIKIYRQDVLTFLSQLPNESVDLIITDPAYSGMNQMLKLGRGKIIGKYSEKGDGQRWFEEFHDTEENYHVFLNECYRVLKKNRHIYIMFDSYSLLSLAPLARKVFDVKNIVVWDKLNIGLGHYFRRRHEFILFASKGKRPLSLKSIPDVWRIKRVTRFQYPAQKPVELFEAMLVGSAEKDFVVLDPFLGSGSSAIASIKRNCQFLGCDIAQSSFDTSKKRISNYFSTRKDILQPQCLVVDEAMIKILGNG